jgi:hypothetical protein
VQPLQYAAMGEKSHRRQRHEGQFRNSTSDIAAYSVTMGTDEGCISVLFEEGDGSLI